MKLKIFFALLFIAVLLVFPIRNSRGASYDLYVDGDYAASDSNGSAQKPYRTISQALEQADSRKKIYIKNGTYKETLTLGKGIELYGQKLDRVIIQGTLETKEDNRLKNITISGKSYGVIASGKITLENCKIKNSSKIGLDLLESNQEATITDSVISGNGKGIYVQRKRTLNLSGNLISGNREEGLDIREKVQGTIQGNEITENGESGLEIIVGGSDLKINGNTLKKNKASGITAQFYSFIEKSGSILIQNNILSKNGKYGFACGNPSGGQPGGSYWNKSIELRENTLENNKIKALDDFCNLIDALDEEEKRTNMTVQNEVAPANSPVENPALDPVAEEKETAETKERLIENQIIEQNVVNSGLIASLEQEMEKIEKISKLKIFFFGLDAEKLAPLEEKKKSLKTRIAAAKALSQETAREETRAALSQTDSALNNALEKVSAFLENKKNSFGLLSWVFPLLERWTAFKAQTTVIRW